MKQQYTFVLILLLLCLLSCVLINRTSAQTEDFDVLDEFDEEASILDTAPVVTKVSEVKKQTVENSMIIEDEQQLEESEAEFQRNAGRYIEEEVDSDILA